MTVELVSTVRRVDPGGTADPYEVSLVGGFRTTSQVPPRAPVASAASLLANAATERSRRERGAAQQKWFRDRAPDAIQALRDLVGQAKGSMFVCDPYFGGEDLLRVVLAIADPGTSVRILTSARHLKNDSGAVGDALEATLAQARGAPPANPMEVRVMPGNDPPIHDRFVLVGDVMWMLGASINHFGERGTLMVCVPDPIPVRDELELIWQTSPTLRATCVTGD